MQCHNIVLSHVYVEYSACMQCCPHRVNIESRLEHSNIATRLNIQLLDKSMALCYYVCMYSAKSSVLTKSVCPICMTAIELKINRTFCSSFPCMSIDINSTRQVVMCMFSNMYTRVCQDC